MARQTAMSTEMIGSWAFMIGLVVAVIAGIVAASNPVAVFVLGILGIIVGLLNISDREVQQFLVAAIAFVVAFASLGTVFSNIPTIGGYLVNILNYLVVFVAPGAAVVGLKSLLQISRMG